MFGYAFGHFGFKRIGFPFASPRHFSVLLLLCNKTTNTAMHPYLQSLLGGLLIGGASWLLLLSLGRVAGVSSIASGAIMPDTEAEEGGRGWRWACVVGLAVGGALMALWWQPPAIAPRPVWLLLGAGFLVGFGSVLGSGCTSGHGVCGLGRRSGRSLVATLTFMAVGMLTVAIVQRIAI